MAPAFEDSSLRVCAYIYQRRDFRIWIYLYESAAKLFVIPIFTRKASYSASFPASSNSSKRIVAFTPFGVPKEWSWRECFLGRIFFLAPEVGRFMLAKRPFVFFPMPDFRRDVVVRFTHIFFLVNTYKSSSLKGYNKVWADNKLITTIFLKLSCLRIKKRDT